MSNVLNLDFNFVSCVNDSLVYAVTLGATFPNIFGPKQVDKWIDGALFFLWEHHFHRHHHHLALAGLRLAGPRWIVGMIHF